MIPICIPFQESFRVASKNMKLDYESQLKKSAEEQNKLQGKIDELKSSLTILQGKYESLKNLENDHAISRMAAETGLELERVERQTLDIKLEEQKKELALLQQTHEVNNYTSCIMFSCYTFIYQ